MLIPSLSLNISLAKGGEPSPNFPVDNTLINLSWESPTQEDDLELPPDQQARMKTIIPTPIFSNPSTVLPMSV